MKGDRNELSDFVESSGVKLSKLTTPVKNDFDDLIDLGLGELSFPTPKHICDAAISAISKGETKYTPARGSKLLIEAIKFKLQRDNSLYYPHEEIIVSSGAKHSLSNVIYSLIGKGDKVLLPTPCWPNYDSLVRMAGGLPKYLRCTEANGFKLDPEELERSICRKTKMFIFSSPCNPTGAVYSESELAGIAKVFLRHPHVFIVSDEIYEYINYTGEHHTIGKFDGLRERVIIINGLSKGFAMTGWRVGYMCGPRSIVDACEKIQARQTSCANSIAQSAAIAALTESLMPTIEMVKQLRKHRDYVIKFLQDIPGVKISIPDGAFYALPDIIHFLGLSDGKNRLFTDQDLCVYLLKYARVNTMNGSAFGAGNHIRIAFGASFDDLRIALTRINSALENLS